jgi:exopolysaccharide biosynthesis polyprenyl glycosylphosphotransferase
MKKSEIVYSVVLIPLDFAALVLAFILAFVLRNNYTLVPPQDIGPLASKIGYTASDISITFAQYLHYISFILPAMLVIFAFTGLYAIRQNEHWFKRIVQIFIGVSIGEFLILLLFLLKKNFFLPRSTVLYSWILGTVFVILGRLILKAIQKYFYSKQIGVIRICVIGDNPAATEIISKLSTPKYSAYRLVDQINSQDLNAIIKKIEMYNLDELIVVNQHFGPAELTSLRNYCLENQLSFNYVPQLLTDLPGSFDILKVGKLPVIEVRATPLEGWGRVNKRLFDVIIASLILIILSPILLIISVLIKVTDPGPLLFKHSRIGRSHRTIKIWKFRTMRFEYCSGNGQADQKFQAMLKANPELEKEWKANFKLKNDFRVTKFGQFLRKTSLDELPQLFNVLKGDLSLVGPRPIVKDEIAKYGSQARILFSLKPGMTGLWQVSGRNDVSYEERINLDSWYIENWSLWQDILILGKTAGAVLRKNSGAY